MSKTNGKWLALVLIVLVTLGTLPLGAFGANDSVKLTLVNFSRDRDRWSHWIQLPDSAGATTRWVDKQFGLDLNYEYVPDANKWDVMNLWAASGNAPAAFVFNTHAGVTNNGAKIKWANLDKYFDDQKNFPRLYDIKHKYGYSLNGLYSMDKHIMGFPIGVNYKVGQPNPDAAYTSGWYIRSDVLKKLGGKRPTTIDELVTTLKKIQAMKGLTGTNGRPIVPLLLPPADWYSECIFFSTWGLTWAGLAKNSFYQWWGLTKQGHDAMKFANKLFNDGLIDSEWVTQKEEIYQEKLKSGQGAIICGWNGGVITDMEAANTPFSYVGLSVPKVPGVKMSMPWNPLPGPASDCTIYVTQNANATQIEKIARLAEWSLTIEGARCLYLGASPEMIELKKDGPYKGKYWLKDAYKALDFLATPDIDSARTKFGSLPIYGPQSYTFKELKVPTVVTPLQKWSTVNLKWMKANGNVSYTGDVGPEFWTGQEALIAKNNAMWADLPAQAQRACILPTDQFDAAWANIVKQAVQRYDAKALCDYQWQNRKAYLEDNNGGGVPKNYPYADLLDEFK